jgi:hypothetical protein
MRTAKKVVVGLFIGLHFFFVAIVISHAYDWMLNRPGFALVAAAAEYYSSITFADRNFGFFAPTVNADWVVDISVTDDARRTHPYHFSLDNQEMRTKFYSMTGHFNESDDNMDLFARSWAVKIMNDDVHASRVDITVSQNQLPTMAEYARGRRIRATPIYRTTFTLRT